MQISWAFDPETDLYKVILVDEAGNPIQILHFEPNEFNHQLVLNISSVFLQIAQDMQEVFVPQLESTANL